MNNTENKAEDGFTICLMDLKEKKVGCVLLQAAYGGDRVLPMQIGTEHWFLAPTENMQLFKIPNSEIPKIIKGFKKISKKNGTTNKTEINS